MTTIYSASAKKPSLSLRAVADEVIRELQNNGGYLTNPRELQAVENVVIQNGDPNIDYIGKDASMILDTAGIRAGTGTVSVVVEVPGDHTFVIDEYLMPVLPVVRVRDFDEAVKGAVAADGGRGHTTMLHTNNSARITQFIQAMNCNVVVVNAPSYACAGIDGEGFLAMTIAGAHRRRIYASAYFHPSAAIDRCRRVVRSHIVRVSR